MAAKRQTIVPGQYLGYSLEATRVLSHLLDGAPGAVVTLEVVGDVAVATAAGVQIVEEDKSITSNANPVADRSVELWKTLGNWSEAIRTGIFDVRTTRFVIYTARPVTAPLIRQLSRAETPTQARRALEATKSVFPLHKRRSIPKTIAPHFTRFFETPDDVLEQLIVRITHETGSGASIADLESKLRSKLIPPELVPDVLKALLGWAKTKLDTAVELGEDAALSYVEFEVEANAVVRKLDRAHILTSFAGEPEPGEVALHLRTKIYVRQLELIDREHDEKLSAVNDFLRARVDRIHWAAQGRVHSSSFTTLESDLTAAWRNLKTRAQIAAAERGEREVGSLLLAECCLHRPALQGASPPDHFIRGSFHALADALSIGWHPRYRDLLSGESGSS